MLQDKPAGIKGKIVDNLIILDISHEEVHYWSPQLTFRVERSPENENHTILSGLIGPRPSVWTMFMFIYFSTGIIGFFISSYSIAKYNLGEFSYTIFAFPIAILFMLTAYQAGKFGEKLGANQVENLKNFIRKAAYLKEISV